MSDDEDDPFDRLDESVGDREGDPFEQLGDAPDESDDEMDASDDESDEDTTAAPAGDDSADEWSPLAGDGVDDDRSTDPETDDDAHDVTPPDHEDELAETDDEAPGDDTAAAVEQSEPTVDTSGASADLEDAFDAGGREGNPFDESVFDEMDVGGVDPDDVWESIAEAEREGSIAGERERTYAEVSKHRYCEQCEFFSAPPEVSCSHEGTEILEFVDNETVRVVDCPIVAERKELEEHD